MPEIFPNSCSPDLRVILEEIHPIFPEPPQIAVVLGSGLGGFADQLEDVGRIPASAIPGYPHSTVHGHKGFVISGRSAGKRLICFQGRVHLYEGYKVEEVVLPIRVAAELGVRNLILTNAAGGINPYLEPGTFMLITDQIDLQFRRKIRAGAKESPNPLPIEREPLFRGHCPYSDRLTKIARTAALENQVELQRGVLGAMLGPSYETPAEVRMERHLGIDAVCMSTVAEAVEGARLGMDVLGISCITNRAAGLEKSTLDHADVIDVASRMATQFMTLLREIIRRI